MYPSKPHLPRLSHLSLALLLLLITGPQAVALESDSQQPVYLDADTAELDNASGKSVYRGNVVLTQGSLEITGDVMTLYTENGELVRAEITGEPATYKQTPEEGEPDVTARAPRMEYHAGGPNHIRLFEGGRLQQGDNVFTGRNILYDTITEVVNADSDGGQERIRIILHPNREDGADGE